MMIVVIIIIGEEEYEISILDGQSLQFSSTVSLLPPNNGQFPTPHQTGRREVNKYIAGLNNTAAEEEEEAPKNQRIISRVSN